MIIKVLGTGCSTCKKLEKHTKDAVKKLGIEAEVIKVEDIKTIMQFGVMKVPGFVIDEKVIFTGKVPKVAELMQIIEENK
ncbi:thioredoxin family protein [Helicovermis profundi]|uniref:Thioredoxin family protein n=1 Tax=Helicovermis profundi TaxID=3065157 RepID=A0AAU9E2Y4_9FIRM|nr:thioredoxin family protein [Clostridia bacterium S502]